MVRRLVSTRTSDEGITDFGQKCCSWLFASETGTVALLSMTRCVATPTSDMVKRIAVKMRGVYCNYLDDQNTEENGEASWRNP